MTAVVPDRAEYVPGPPAAKGKAARPTVRVATQLSQAGNVISGNASYGVQITASGNVEATEVQISPVGASAFVNRKKELFIVAGHWPQHQPFARGQNFLRCLVSAKIACHKLFPQND